MGDKRSGAGGSPASSRRSLPPRVVPRGSKHDNGPLHRVVQRGSVRPETLEALIPRGTPNTWKRGDGRLAEGFRYTLTRKGEKYVIHGHGRDSTVPKGNNAERGAVVRIERLSDRTWLNTSGKWVDRVPNANATHIPLNRRRKG